MDSELENRAQEQSEGQKEGGREGYKSSGNYQKEYQPTGRSQRPRIHVSRAYPANRPDDDGGFRPEGFGEKLHQSNETQQRNPYRQRFNANQQQGGYQPRQQGGYRPRYNDGNQGGYQPRQQGGYRPRYNDGEQDGYQPRQQGGYQSRQQGGYQSRQGGYQPRQQGGYQSRQGGYQPRQQGGYQPRQQGGYQPRQQGGYQPRQQGGYKPNNNRQRPSFSPAPKFNMKRRVDYGEGYVDPNESLRLNKFLANAGVCSRREADDFIMAGVVSVNGEIVTELGTKVKRTDEVKFHDQLVKLEKKVYVLLNKPKDCVTTSDDPQQRTTVMDLVKGACPERIYPVGRLDRNTTGVLLLTNDGDLASKLTHPKFLKKKIYHVFLDKKVTAHDLQQILDGVQLEDGEVRADAIEYADERDKSQVGIEIHSGKNRIVRRIFESLGYRVVKLDRVQFAGLTKKNVRRGDWRYLTEKEVDMLRMGAFE
ncbi:MAG: pseudouridine synthase [Prevotella sp.]|nr:pseudouridine synthase [Prevotella sp.]MBQ1667212.1 pseudouridine synthase [Prevotella sp.]MBQ1759711.1 pseudouridine synthase [Prevotella sp.]MBQ1799949.1 pseudouridine synthase [Prevotella sp.]MBQ2495606.1 pseudouridine synthase [Prevotella sp.]